VRIVIAIVVVAVTALPGISTPGHAENCKDPEEARREGGVPCMDASGSFGSLENLITGDLIDVRVRGPRLALYSNGDRVRPGGADPGDGGLVTWGAEAFDLEFFATQFFIDKYGYRSHQDQLWSIGSLRRQIDHQAWGWYATLAAVSGGEGSYRILTPAVGARLGRFDRAALLGDARFRGVRAFDSGDWSLAVARDVDVRLRATVVATPWLRLEARGRFRDANLGAHHHVRDLFGALGVELAVTGLGRPSSPMERQFRMTPLFIGLGARRVIADDQRDREPVAFIAREISEPARGPWQLLLWAELDFAVASKRSLWW